MVEFSSHELRHIIMEYIRPVIVVHDEPAKLAVQESLAAAKYIIPVLIDHDCAPGTAYILEKSALPIPPGGSPAAPEGRNWESWMDRYGTINPKGIKDTRDWWLDAPAPLNPLPDTFVPAEPEEEDDV